MHNDMIIEFKSSTVENLQLYSELLNKDINTMLEEALKMYFEKQQRILDEEHAGDDMALTNLDYDEFWDGLDV